MYLLLPSTVGYGFQVLFESDSISSLWVYLHVHCTLLILYMGYVFIYIIKYQFELVNVYNYSPDLCLGRKRTVGSKPVWGFFGQNR